MALGQDVSAPPSPGSAGHASSVEIIQKELAAHKEMVTELRTQLVEKEVELQVIISKPSCF